MTESLLDTDILSYYFRGDEGVTAQVDQYLLDFPALNISYITCFEILSGLAHKGATRQIQDFELFLTDCNLLNLSESSIRISAKISGNLKRKGYTVGNSDLLIAGISIENNLTLITNNHKHFSVIENLKIENWKVRI